MGIFDSLKTEGLEQAEDRLGGFAALETDAYTGKIILAYAGKSDGGATNVTVHFDHGGTEYRETVYVSNKKGENWFPNKQDPTKKVPLPGFTVINDICLMLTNKELADQDTEEKMVKIYDYDERKEVPKSVQVLVDLLGGEVTLGIQNTLKNKGVKQGDGSYVDGPEERNENNIVKVFHEPTKMTVQEATSGATEAAFYPAWVERNKGKVIDKRSNKDGQAGSTNRPGAKAGAAPAAGGGERKSLFNKG